VNAVAIRGPDLDVGAVVGGDGERYERVVGRLVAPKPVEPHLVGDLGEFGSVPR
jgi:hypothetical protein